MKARENQGRPPLRRPRRADIGDAGEMQEQDDDLELEKVRLISLALEFGFDEDSANMCLNRLIELYGNSRTPQIFPIPCPKLNPKTNTNITS